MVCKRPIIREIKLVGENWLRWLIGFAGISRLWLPTCVHEMGWVILVMCSTGDSGFKKGEEMQSHD